MAKHLIVPLDGSERAEGAIPIALSIAARTGAAPVFVCASAEAELTDPEGYLEAAALAWNVPEIETVVIYDRMAPAAISFVAAEHPDPVICMTTRGRGAVSTAVLGSVATDVLREVPCPVILAGPHLAVTPWVPGPIVVGVDGEQAPGRILGAAATLAAALDVPLWLVQVLATTATTGEHDGTLVDTGYVERLARPLGAAGLAVGWDVVHAGEVAPALLAFAESRGAHMVAIATRARTGIGGLVLGSTARQLVQAATVPVLITHVGD